MIKERIHKILDFPKVRTISARLTAILLIFSSLVYGIIAILESNMELWQHFYLVFIILSCITGFTIILEYFLRLWTYNQKVGIENSNYFTSIKGIIDLIGAISFIMFLIGIFDYKIMEIARILRFFVFLKFARYSKSFKIIFASTVIYYLERSAQPDKFPDILTALWMGIITFTTTGFGDVYPITMGGRFFTIALAFLGVPIFILPAGILGSSFFSTMQEYRYYKICPKCEFIISRPKISIRK